MDQYKTHYVIYKDYLNKPQKIIITNEEYSRIVIAMNNKCERIILDKEKEFSVKRVDIKEISRIKNEELFNNNDIMAICPDCDGRINLNSLKEHYRNCLRQRTKEFFKKYPGRALYWEEKIEKLFKIKNNKTKTIIQKIFNI